ncbi:hypothetical protein NPX13_g4738 [Xylaria arbuscula]|uniref:Uncharacterized protein n=1 Tax=Xylaria arbuscula TaxID=114810 RepID=A0A9W8NFX4_9PEZI|nr:hypothetical protein NPX13_g4738 [Xylaria arbuscula]
MSISNPRFDSQPPKIEELYSETLAAQISRLVKPRGLEGIDQAMGDLVSGSMADRASNRHRGGQAPVGRYYGETTGVHPRLPDQIPRGLSVQAAHLSIAVEDLRSSQDRSYQDIYLKPPPRARDSKTTTSTTLSADDNKPYQLLNCVVEGRESKCALWLPSDRAPPADAYERLSSCFSDTTFIEDGGFTIVHKIIFGYIKCWFDEILRDLPDLVNQQDAYGLSPLHLAATRGDVESITTLLEHNAKGDMTERDGSTPLIWGVDSANPDVSERLLEAGADSNDASNIRLDRALHIACHEERFNC